MGRGQKSRVNRDRNTSTLPQTPKNQKRNKIDGEELEIAQSLDDRYELKAKPGLTPTEVTRKD